MLHESFNNGVLPCSTRKSVLTLIHKKGDKDLLANYRPISLTNYDYKILTTTLANRLQSILPNLISTDQTGYIKNRYIGVNARVVCDIIDHCEKNQKPGAIVCLDFEKAFDSLNWNFMIQALDKFGFGSNFIKWIKILYEKNSFCVKNNGYLSRDSTMGRGVRQGCAVSALLFILSLEFLAENIRINKDIKGIKLHKKEVYISLYADDITLMLANEGSVSAALETIKSFSVVSGLKLNIHKCEGLWLVPLCNNLNVYQNIKFNQGPIRCLGVHIDRNMDECHSLNWDKKIASIEDILLRWSCRKLTIYGKIEIINTLALPKLIYYCSILPVPDIVIQKLEKILLSFLWGKSQKVKKTVIINSCVDGGLGFCDIESKIWAIKAAWIPKIMHIEILNNILHLHLSKIGLDLKILLCMNFKNVKTLPIMKCIPKFYQDVFVGFNKCKTLKPLESMKSHEILTQVIWGNEYFKNKHQTLYFKNWIDSGFTFVKDLLDIEGNWLTSDEIINRLSITTNWIIELSILRKILNKVLKKTDVKTCKYIQKPLLFNPNFYYKNKLIQPMEMTTKELYHILTNKKCTRSYVEGKWEKVFGLKLNAKDWQNIYSLNLYSLRYKKFSEFKYKILLDFLPCGNKLYKWNNTVSENCNLCNTKEDVCHMLYSCETIKCIWMNFSNCLNVNITMKHVILGPNNDDYISINNHLCITIVSYSIFSAWCKSSFDKKQYTSFKIKLQIYKNLVFYRDVFRLILNKKQFSNLETKINCMLFHISL